MTKQDLEQLYDKDEADIRLLFIGAEPPLYIYKEYTFEEYKQEHNIIAVNAWWELHNGDLYTGKEVYKMLSENDEIFIF